jgi:hypothetical protein
MLLDTVVFKRFCQSDFDRLERKNYFIRHGQNISAGFLHVSRVGKVFLKGF